MLYTSSQSTTDGVVTLTVTFALGTDLDKAQVQVQNRVAQTLPKLPEVTQRLGVTTDKATPDLTLVVNLTSPNQRYDMAGRASSSKRERRCICAPITRFSRANSGTATWSMRRTSFSRCSSTYGSARRPSSREASA